MLLEALTIGYILSIILVIIAIVFVVLVVTKIGRLLIRVIVGAIMNTVLGFLVLFAINYFFGITIAYTQPEMASIVLFGLPAVGTLLILKVVGGIALLISL